MRTEHKIFALSTIISLLLAGLFYQIYLSPASLPKDMQVVQLEDRVPPFYENIFRVKDISSTDFLINDPVTGVRGKPLLPQISGVGPHDLLGFRNCAVPSQADLVVIGDSQTYGNNALLHQSWPAQLEELLQSKNITVYQMATGSWSIPQYRSILSHAFNFRPQAIVIAIYTGNDLYEAFRLVYSNVVWKRFRVDPNLKLSDLPKVNFPPATSEQWSAKFKNGESVIFTPKHRLVSNNRAIQAIQAAELIVNQAVAEMAEEAAKFSVPLIITVIPTKELVYEEHVQAEIKDPPQEFLELIRNEREIIQGIEQAVSKHAGLKFVNSLPSIQLSLKEGRVPYPADSNGHPNALGYSEVARAIYPHLDPLLSGRGKKFLVCG